MRKLLFLVVLLVQITATAFAYTNKTDGFKTFSPSSDNYIVAVSRHFYGFADNTSQQAGYAETLTPERADKFLGTVFTTAAFDKTYHNVLLLQRNGISQEQIKKLVADPFVSPLIASAGTSCRDYTITAEQFGKNDYIVVTAGSVDGGQSLKLFYTSGNDRLYMLMAETAPKLPKLTEATIGVIGSADGPTEIIVEEGTETNLIPDSKFLANFKTFKPGNDVTAFGFKDKIAGLSVNLPEDWFYVQIKDARSYDEKIAATFALPLQALPLMQQAFGIGLGDAAESAIGQQMQAESSEQSVVGVLSENKEQIFEILSHGIVLFSVETDNKELAEFITVNSNKTEYSINAALADLKDYLIEQNFEIKTFDYSTGIENGRMGFDLQTELKPPAAGNYYRLAGEGKLENRQGFIALIFDREDDNAGMAYKMWNNKVNLNK